MSSEMLTKPVASEITACVNCGDAVSTAYCGACGQPRKVRSISWKGLWEEMDNHWLGTNNRFTRTLIHLITKPQQVVQSYLQGNRVQYLGPLSYYLIITALILLLLSILQVDMEAFLQASAPTQEADNAEAKAFQTSLMHYISAAFRYLSILIIPFYLLALRNLFKKHFANGMEMTVVLLYLFSQSFIFTLIQGLSFALFQMPLILAAYVLNMIYCLWFFGRIFTERFSWKNGVKGTLVYILGFLYFMIFLGLISVSVGLVYGFLS